MIIFLTLWQRSLPKIFFNFLFYCSVMQKKDFHFIADQKRSQKSLNNSSHPAILLKNLFHWKYFLRDFIVSITILFCFTSSIQRGTEATQNNALETYLTFTDVSITKLFIWKLEQFGYCMVLISTCYALHVTKFKVVLWQHFMLINVASFCSFHHW